MTRRSGRQTVNHEDLGSNPSTAVSKLRNVVHPTLPVLEDVDPFSVVSSPEELIVFTQRHAQNLWTHNHISNGFDLQKSVGGRCISCCPNKLPPLHLSKRQERLVCAHTGSTYKTTRYTYCYYMYTCYIYCYYMYTCYTYCYYMYTC